MPTSDGTVITNWDHVKTGPELEQWANENGVIRDVRAFGSGEDNPVKIADWTPAQVALFFKWGMTDWCD